MRLEIPAGTDVRQLKRDLLKLGKDWEFRWEERTRGGRFDPLMMRALFGSLN